ncbi:hypothetical protein PF327_02375 [Sulfurovum sp. XTW-4]|uniref:Uncharacterized protein n=1 Tax=Sulfurovum xiamenensis TaxID=3019066 RepID=A0ABT7QPL7_9BACT|nr:hypothetical protein [Sulfurovum xiamenensis]MDM5263034.1 hypothetical protein [Sulfurovum xiamenensis]
MLKNSELNRVCKRWNKPTINKLQVNKTLGGIGSNNENNGHPDGSPKSVGQVS